MIHVALSLVDFATLNTTPIGVRIRVVTLYLVTLGTQSRVDHIYFTLYGSQHPLVMCVNML